MVKLKVPKKAWARDIERIEIKFPTSFQGIKAGILPVYEIRAFFKTGSKTLGDVYVRSDRLSSNRGKYIVTFDPKDEGKWVDIGEVSTLRQADHLAHSHALDLGYKLAKEKGVHLDDLTREDQERLEGEEMDYQLKMHRQRRIAIFFLISLGGIALSIFSLQSTGNAIGNLTGTTQGLFGILLFVAGLFGLLFNTRKK